MMTKTLLKFGWAVLGCGWAAWATAQEADRIGVNGEINGQPVRLIFDTGASATALFKPAADRLQLKVEAPPANTPLLPGQTLVSRTEPVDFKVQTFTQRGPLAVLDLPEYLAHNPWDGMLSMRTIPAKIFTLDVFNQRVQLGEAMPPEALGWAKFPQLTNAPLLAFAAGKEDPAAGRVAVDTGSPDGVSLGRVAWEKFLAQNGAQPATLTAYYTPGVGLVVRTQVWAPEVVIGALRLQDVPVQAMAPAEEAIVPGLEKGAILGLFALRKMDLVVDVSIPAVYAQPQARPALKYPHNQLGAVFVPLTPQSDALIARVVPGSPAHEAGIRDGDELLKIDGEDLTQWRQRGLSPNTRFSQSPPGTAFQFTLRRADRELQARAELRSLIGPDPAASRQHYLAQIRAEAEQGKAGAQTALGLMYLAGKGVAKDEAEAVKWLRLAAAQNSAQAQYSLGACLAKGIGVKQDPEESVKWLRAAAEQNNAEAQAMLGLCYVLGKGVPTNALEAYQWLFLAAEQGHAKAKEACALIAGELTAEQIAEAQKQAKKLKK